MCIKLKAVKNNVVTGNRALESGEMNTGIRQRQAQHGSLLNETVICTKLKIQRHVIVKYESCDDLNCM